MLKNAPSACHYSTQLESVQGEIKERFEGKKAQADVLSGAYADLFLRYRDRSFLSRADRVSDCGSWLEFGLFADDSHRLLRANFCRDRLCPMCNWRRSLKLFSQVSSCMNLLESQGYDFLFLTLTIKNCSGDDLSEIIDKLFSAWRYLYNKSAPFKKKIIFGTFRSLEITRNKKDGTFHPHLHCILAVQHDYFTGNGYLSQKEWSELWKKALQVDYTPVIDIRRIKNTSGSAAEVAKYSVKGSDYLSGKNITDNVLTFLLSLSGRRLCGFTGVFADARRFLNLDDPEDGDLVKTDLEDLRSDVLQAVVTYHWGNGFYDISSFEEVS